MAGKQAARELGVSREIIFKREIEGKGELSKCNGELEKDHTLLSHGVLWMLRLHSVIIKVAFELKDLNERIFFPILVLQGFLV